jgi:hypothetical protein
MREGKVARMDNGWPSGADLERCGEHLLQRLHERRALLEKVDHPVATNPDARLRALAQERGWRILDLFTETP